RLATARRMLAKRLTRRGLALSAGLLGAILSENAGNAFVPHSLVAATVQAARVITGKGIAGYTISAHVAALTKGVLKSMVVSKLKTTALGLGAFGALALGLCTGIAMPRSQTAQAAQPQTNVSSAVTEPANTPAKSHKARDEHADLRKILELHIGVDCHICHSSP